MKIAATVILFVAALFIADGMYSGVSVGDTIKADFLNLEAPEAAPAVEAAEDADEQVIEDWIDTVRRRRTRRQSRFC